MILSGGLHPHYRATTETYCRFLEFDAVAMPPSWSGDEDSAARLDRDAACVVVQNPDLFGRVHDYSALARACHAQGALLVVVVNEVVSLGALVPPGDMGADIVAGEGQSLGNAPTFGGPTVGLLAARQRFVRQMPGRLVGETVDVDGRRGFVLTLSTREQHIRREKATSNICTNSGLCALAFTIHLTMLGEIGLTRLAELNHARAVELAEKLEQIEGVAIRERDVLQRVHIASATAGRRRGRGDGAARRSRRSAACPACCRPGPRPNLSCWSPPPRPTPSDDMDAFVAALKESLLNGRDG